jgi:hypothetical protein
MREDACLERHLQRGLGCKSRGRVSSDIKLPRHAQLTFLMPAGFRCKATSFSGLTRGMLELMLHVIFQKERRGLVVSWTESLMEFRWVSNHFLLNVNQNE